MTAKTGRSPIALNTTHAIYQLQYQACIGQRYGISNDAYYTECRKLLKHIAVFFFFIESVVANSFVPSDFLVDGQVSGLGTVHPLLTLSFYSTWILPLHVVFNVEEEVVGIRNGWTPKNFQKKFSLRNNMKNNCLC